MVHVYDPNTRVGGDRQMPVQPDQRAPDESPHLKVGEKKKVEGDKSRHQTSISSFYTSVYIPICVHKHTPCMKQNENHKITI